MQEEKDIIRCFAISFISLCACFLLVLSKSIDVKAKDNTRTLNKAIASELPVAGVDLYINVSIPSVYPLQYDEDEDTQDAEEEQLEEEEEQDEQVEQVEQVEQEEQDELVEEEKLVEEELIQVRQQRDIPYMEYTEQDVVLLAKIMYLEEGIYVQDTEGEYVLKLAGSCVLHRIESELFPNTMEEVIYAEGQYAKSTLNQIDTVVVPDEVYVWAEELLYYGPLGPNSLVYQAQFKQGEIYETYGNQYFCMSKYITD